MSVIISFFILSLIFYFQFNFQLYPVANFQNIFHPPSLRHLFGTDDMGRDMSMLILKGLIISIKISFSGVFFAFILGGIIGLLSIFHDKIGLFIDKIIDLHLSFPTLILALFFITFYGHHPICIILAIIFSQWPYFARQARIIGLQEKIKDYILAAKLLPYTYFTLVRKHLFKKTFFFLSALLPHQIARAIMLEAGLSFLGLGLKNPNISLGALISMGFEYFMADAYWISFFPGLILTIFIVVLHIIGDKIAPIFNIKE